MLSMNVVSSPRRLLRDCADAPEGVVQQRQDRAEDLRAQLTKIIQNLADLE